MMNALLETMDLEVRIAAAAAVREHIQAETEQEDVINALTDALISLRTEQVEKIWPSPPL